MAKNGSERRYSRPIQKWRCAVTNNEHYRAWYDHMPGPAYNRLLLRVRRQKALARMNERKERRDHLRDV